MQLWHLDSAEDPTAKDKRISQPQEIWTREESLATVRVAEFVEFPEAGGDARSPGTEGGEGFIHRVIRQIGDAKVSSYLQFRLARRLLGWQQNFPQYLTGFVKRFVLGSPAIATVISDSTSSARDAFGFRQILVLATLHGKVFGIDSSNGEILWSRVLGLGWAAEVGGTIHPVKMFGGFGVGGSEVILVTQRRADNVRFFFSCTFGS